MPGALAICSSCGKPYEVKTGEVDDSFCSFECWEHESVGIVPRPPIMEDLLEAA